MAVIAREVALSLSQFSFLPSAVHTPGVAHVIADSLSRMNDPSKVDSRSILSHPALVHAECTHIPARTREYYKALSPLSSQKHGGNEFGTESGSDLD